MNFITLYLLQVRYRIKEISAVYLDNKSPSYPKKSGLDKKMHNFSAITFMYSISTFYCFIRTSNVFKNPTLSQEQKQISETAYVAWWVKANPALLKLTLPLIL